jgi:hypothetical protein
VRQWAQKICTEEAMRIAAALLVLAAMAALAVIPTRVVEHGPVICMWRNLLGIQCPFCGMTRAFSSVLHGQFRAAFQYNRLVTVVFPFTCAMLVRELLRLRRFDRFEATIDGKSRHAGLCGFTKS